MKRLPIIPFAVAASLIVTVCALPASGASTLVPQGQTLEGLAMKSAILGRDVKYAVYLPPDYGISTRRYPVVYLLHGYTDDETTWIQSGEVPLAADKAIAERTIPPMIIVMPDGGVTWYVNDYRNGVRYEDMFIQEFIPFIDATYRTRTERWCRGISGLSMGGLGTLLYAMHHPDLFGACAAFSGAVRTDEEVMAVPQDRYETVSGPIYGPKLAGRDRLTPHFRANNPLDLAKTLPEESLKSVRYYIDCGDDDFLIRGNMALHQLLSDRKIPHEFRVRDGGHTWSYWRTGIVDALEFIGRSFHR
jgi:enterochelin esterase-like enzyme